MIVRLLVNGMPVTAFYRGPGKWILQTPPGMLTVEVTRKSMPDHDELHATIRTGMQIKDGTSGLQSIPKKVEKPGHKAIENYRVEHPCTITIELGYLTRPAHMMQIEWEPLPDTFADTIVPQ